MLFLLLLSVPIEIADDDTQITWEATLTITEEGGVQDIITFGEATNALDDVSPDSYDLPKPPSPIPPSIYAYFTTNFDEPYNKLLQDYRPDTTTDLKWNLVIQWFPQDLNSSTTITITWDITNFTQSNYDTIELYNKEADSLLANMQTEDSYTTSAAANIPHHFTIKCSQTNSNQNSTPFPSIIYFITLLLIIMILKYRKNHR